MSNRIVIAFIALCCAVLPISSMGQAESRTVRASEIVEQQDHLDHLLDVAAAL